MTGSGRAGALRSLADDVSGDAGRAGDAAKVRMLGDAVRALAGAAM